jgi:hypothetical protein
MSGWNENVKPEWWVCTCGHGLDAHSARRHESQSGLTYSACRVCGSEKCARFVNVHGQDFYDGGLRGG